MDKPTREQAFYEAMRIFTGDSREFDEHGFSAGPMTTLDMPQARRFALALLDAPDANVEQMIAELRGCACDVADALDRP